MEVGKINPIKAMNPNINPELMQHEINTNPLVRLQMSDQNLISEIRKSMDPKQAEMLIKRKLETIGLDPKEVAIVLMRDGERYPLQRAMSETGLSEEDLNMYYDGAVAKINNVINGGGILGNVRALFGK